MSGKAMKLDSTGKFPKHKFNRMKTFCSLVLCAVFFSGCATNPYTQFYQSYTNQMPASALQALLPPTPEPQLYTASSQDYRDECHKLEERSFVMIGSSGFRGGNPTRQQLIEQAKRVGADVVLQASVFSHTEQGAMPLFSYQPGQTYTTTHSGTATANVYGRSGVTSGYGSYSGTSSTTTPGTLHTDYVPYQRQVFDNGASFWRRMKRAIFGVGVVPIPDAMRSTLQRNTGALVDLVIQDSPAFRANILQGDVIIQIAEKQILSAEDFGNVIPNYAGQKITVKVIRGGQTLGVDVQLHEAQ